jgi:hypothetical protein
MDRSDGSMAWYGYLTLPLTLTAGIAVFCTYQMIWVGLGLYARTHEAFKEQIRRPLSPLERLE